MRRLNSTCLLIGVSLLSACTPAAPPVVVKPPIVTVGNAVERPTRDYVDNTGRTAAVESVLVRARVGGYLQKILFKEGDQVKKDQVLFEIDPRPYKAALDQAVAELKMREAQATEAKSIYDRELVLQTKKATSAEDVEKALRSYEVGKAGIEAAKAGIETKQLSLDYTKVMSPINGRVDKANITVGNLVAADLGGATVLTSVVDEDPVYAYFDVDERTVLGIRELIRKGKLKPREETPREVLLGLGTGTDFPYRGHIDFVSNQVNTSTGTIQVRGVFPNKDLSLLPGLFARVRVLLGEPRPAILISEQVIVRNQGKTFVLLVNDKNEVVNREITVGAMRDGLRVVESGVTTSDKIIINGMQRVRPGVVVEPKQGEMVPSAAPSPQAKSAS